MQETKIALLGLGLMGTGMAGRLLDAQYPLTVWNRTPAKAEPLVARGARLAQSPREAVAGAAVVISMLADVPVCRDVWLGRGEALASLAPGAVLVESSTVTVDWIHELARAAAEHGCELVDAPVTGSKPQAAAGQLLFLAGGSVVALGKLDPILRSMGRDVVHVGPGQRGAPEADQQFSFRFPSRCPGRSALPGRTQWPRYTKEPGCTHRRSAR